MRRNIRVFRGAQLEPMYIRWDDVSYGAELRQQEAFAPTALTNFAFVAELQMLVVADCA